MKIDRLFSIVLELLNRERVSAAELAVRFEVSVRTIYRDVEAIDRAGIPVMSYAGRDGGFGILPNFKLERQFLSFSDMLTILSSLKGMEAAFGENDLKDAIGKIRSLVPQNRAAELERRQEQIHLDIRPWGYRNMEQETLAVISDAVKQSRLLKFRYSDSVNKASERTIEPMTLVFKGYAWYLFGYCLLRNDYRLFRISRMRDPEMLDGGFERRGMTYVEFEKQTEGEMKTVVLTLRFPKNFIARAMDYFPGAKLVEELETFTVTVNMPDTEWLDSFLLSFGGDMEVVSPENVRARVLKTAEAVAGRYKK